MRLVVRPGTALARVKPSVQKIEAARAQGKVGPPALHRVSVLVVFDGAIETPDQVRQIRDTIHAAADAGLTEVAVDATPRAAARLRQSIQSVLNVLDVAPARELLREAHGRKVRLTHPYELDVQSMARTIWTGLYTARSEGFAAGKYGLVPMTLAEQRTTIELVTRWTKGWTAIPAFYVDTPLVTDDDVLEPTRCVDAARLWLTMVRGAGVSLVLFDAPDRVTPRRLLRQSDATDDPGVLTLGAVDQILVHARELGVRILWSGGITGPQAFELARRRVHGIFSTSSTARKIPVSKPFKDDPRLAAENEPTELGIRRIHAVVQGGFLATALESRDAALASSIGATARTLLGTTDAAAAERTLRELDGHLQRGWRALAPATRPAAAPANEAPVPVPPDAIRVFRGRRQPTLAAGKFVEKLGELFMPATVQIQRLYGLTAYLPAVLPTGHAPGLPDEIALVFYRTQEAYGFAKRCVGGRAYGDLHDLVFDMPHSPSGFPKAFTGTVERDQPYHLFSQPVDWQLGTAGVYVGTRKPDLAPEVFAREAGTRAKALQQASAVDAAVLVVSADWLICWIHGPGDAPPPLSHFADIAGPAFERAARRIDMPPDLLVPYDGLRVAADGDFLNMRFPRI